MENNELQSMQEQIAKLEKRIIRLETLIDGSVKGKPGRKSKLSLEQKKEIILKHNQGTSYSILAKEYQISRSTVFNICQGHKNEEDLIVDIIRHRNKS